MHKLTQTTMWKKLLAVLATFGVLATNIAFADTVYTLLTEVTLNPASGVFNPSATPAGTLGVTVKTSASATVAVYALKLNTDGTIASTYWRTAGTNTTSYTTSFNGRDVKGVVLPNGDYTLRVIAATSSYRETKDVKFTVTNSTVTPSPYKLLSEVTLNPATGVFNPSATPTPETLGVTVKVSAPAVAIVSLLKLNADDTIATTYWYKASVVNAVTALSATFNGKDDKGVVLPSGDYTMRVVVAATGYSTEVKDIRVVVTGSGTTTPTTNPNVDECGAAKLSSTIIKNLCVDQPEWDPSDDELNIQWDLVASDHNIDTFVLKAEKLDGTDDVELWSDEEMDNDNYEFDWNGLNDDDEYIGKGLWKITVKADNDTVSFVVDVQYAETKVLSDSFLTKSEFDNTVDEATSFVFRVSQDSIVTVDVVEDNSTSHKVVRLWDKEEINKKLWYVVKWDGTDDDGTEVDEGSYKFKITTANQSNDNVKVTSYSEAVTVKEDTVSSSRSNVIEDYIQPVVITKDTSDEATITYTIDEDADVTVEIFQDGKSSNPEVVLVDDVSKAAGTYTVSWNVRDEDGKKLKKDTKYSYRVTAKVSGSSSKTDKERGYFVIGNPGNEEDTTDNTDSTDDNDNTTPASCKGLFRDVSENSPHCEAVAWAYDWGVIKGDAGFLRLNSYVNRAEALAMTLRGFYVMTLPSDGTDLGFKDVAPYGWYTSYLRTGMFLGMVNGDAKLKLARPEEFVNRAEFAKYLTKAEISLNDFVPSCGYYNTYLSDVEPNAWYGDYVCVVSEYNLLDTSNGRFDASRFVTRGEVIEALYQLNKQGLLYVETK